MEHTIIVTIETNAKDKSFVVTTLEPESGETTSFPPDFGFVPSWVSPSGHEKFNKTIGDEIYSWISTWIDNEEEEENED